MANIGYLQLVRHCNQRCRFCSNPATPFTLDEESMRRHLDDFVQRGYQGVILTGGEPSLSPIAAETARHAVARGLQVRMISNGSGLADASSVRRLMDAGLRHYHLSIHSSRQDVHDFLTGTPGSSSRVFTALEHLGRQGATVDVNTVINHYNADHLDETVRALTARFPFLRHFVWNNIDPSIGLARDNPDTRARLCDFELSLAEAMRTLARGDRTFRVERVPLCFMVEFAHCSTETRKIVKGEERMVHFLDEKGTVRQTNFHHTKTATCQDCSLASICAGLFHQGPWYDPKELHAVFVSREEIIRRVQEIHTG